MLRLLTTVYFIAASFSIAYADSWRDCRGNASPAAVVQNCTQFIAEGKFDRRRSKARAFENRGRAYARLGKHDSAVEDFTKALENQKGSPTGFVYRARGLSYAEIGEFKSALSDFNRLIQISTSQESGRYKGSKEIEAIRKRGRATDFVIRGQLFEKNGKVDKAIDDYRKALGFDPKLKQVEARVQELSVPNGQSVNSGGSAIAIAYCHKTGHPGVGSSNRTDIDYESNVAAAVEVAKDRCLAAAGPKHGHGCCEIKIRNKKSGFPCIALASDKGGKIGKGFGRNRKEAVLNAKESCGSGFCEITASKCVS